MTGVWEDGKLIEKTYDWFAQDKQGTVWYFGEDTKEYENGEVVSTKGSWEAGVDGAKPGIIMPPDPKVGHSYHQEYYPGEAMDMARVLSLTHRSHCPTAHLITCLRPGSGRHCNLASPRRSTTFVG